MENKIDKITPEILPNALPTLQENCSAISTFSPTKNTKTLKTLSVLLVLMMLDPDL
jgi:hypothetical protein